MNSYYFMRIFLLFCLWLVIPGSQIYGQFYSQGQDPGSVNWNQINTENFQVIFPEEFVDQAKYVADILEFAYTYGGASLGHQPRRIPVILHNQTVIANGFVSWAPRRIEIYSNPPQNNDGHDWLESISLHEFRHVVQVDKLNQGVTRILNILLGEQATGIVLGLYVPLWFLEGDAVAAETALTNSGRGRLPRFEQGLRAQVLQKGLWSYDKAVFGSYKDHVPNHYELGYQLVAAARAQYSADVWDGVITNVARRPYSITPFTGGLKKQTGAGKVELYHNTFEFLDSAWTLQKQSHQYTPYTRVSNTHKLYTNYRYPIFIDESTVIALKTGMGDIPTVVSINLQGEEKRLFSPGITNPYAFTSAGGLIAWSQVRNDARWQHRSWSEIHIYDIGSGRRSKLTRNTRFFAPSLNHQGSMIVAVEVTSLNENSLVIIDVQTGEVINRIPSPDNDFLMTPSWHADGITIAAIALDDHGKRIVTADTGSKEFRTVAGPDHIEKSRPVFHGDDLLFNGSYNGIDNIYRLSADGTISKIVSSEFGGVDAAVSPKGELIVWSDYNSEGYRLVVAEKNHLEEIALGEVEDHSVRLHQVLTDQEAAVISSQSLPRNSHQVENYSRLANLFHLHSWGPFALNVDNLEAVPGASLFMQNRLSTSFASMGYQYDMNEETGKFYLNYSYQGWYPQISIQGETGQRRSYYRDQNQQLIEFPWRESSVQLASSIPFTFRRNHYFYGLVPTVRTGIIQAAPVSGSPDQLLENNLWQMQYRLLAYRQVFSVRRDVRPRWGQIADVNFRNTPFGTGEMGSVFSTRLIGFFPGLFRHHSFQLGVAYQRHIPADPPAQRISYRFPNLVNYPRGISGQFHNELYSFSLDYAFPLFYPDWSLPPVLYLQRLRMNLFADYAFGEISGTDQQGAYHISEEINTFGVDIIGDMHIVRFLSPVTLGSRIIYEPTSGEVLFRLIFGVSF